MEPRDAIRAGDNGRQVFDVRGKGRQIVKDAFGLKRKMLGTHDGVVVQQSQRPKSEKDDTQLNPANLQLT